MLHPVSSKSSKPHSAATTTDGQVKSIADLRIRADRAVASLFEAFARDVRPQPCKPFTVGTGDITRLRAIVSKWAPLSYEPHQTQSQFDVPYVLSNFFKRYISTSEKLGEKGLQAKAAIKFLRTNKDGECIDSYVLNHPQLLPLITKMRRIVGECFQDQLALGELYALTGHGPNSTTDVKFSDAYLHLKDKSIFGTQASLQQFRHYLHWDNQLLALLVEESDELRALLNAVNTDFTANIVSCTETSFVPKSYDSLRTMCPEPTLVAYFAQMIAKFITDKLLSLYNIDLRSQPKVHKDMAKLGSMIAELFIATVDWSEASDRIWTLLVEEVMTEGNAPKWFNFMKHVCRVGKTSVKWSGCFGAESDFVDVETLTQFLQQHTTEFDIKLGKKGTYKVTSQLNTTMFATMGNPITFPLQTLIFYAFLQACTELFSEQDGHLSLDDLTFPSSFGDDGIVDSRVMGVVEHFAGLLNWKLNRDKSFSDGAFRESCGGDFYSGRYCRPFMPKAPEFNVNLNLARNIAHYQAWLYVCANGATELCHALGKDPINIEAWLVHQHDVSQLGKVLVVPPSYPDGSGLRVSGLLGSQQGSMFDAWDTSDVGLVFNTRSLRGLGWDGPNISFSSHHDDLNQVFGQYQWPIFLWRERVFLFYALQSIPGDMEVAPWDQPYYYHYRLKESGDSIDPQFWYQSFFDITSKTTPMLRGDAVPRKECVIYKRKVTTPFWG